ncbi:MAG TPA: xanthine dehydrogenase family protein subunit M [Thermoplasmata archaeon]|nr:xanthine dehydrogenase family protein subunit M [Thermoplasmata archaeon]
MHPRAFEYVRASSVPEAVALLAKGGEDAKILAGGQSLIPLMKLRLAAPSLVIDIGHIPGLSGIREEGGFLRIGAMTRHREFESSPLIRERYPLLADAVKVLGDPQVRNLGTIGGSLVHADPAGDWGTALLALDTELVATGPAGDRSLSIDRFFEDPFTTALSPSELLTEIRIPKAPARSGGAYKKLKRKTGDFATVAVSARLLLGPEGKISEARVGIGAVAPVPFRSIHAEDSLKGRSPSDAAFGEAGRLASVDSQPGSDLHGSPDYKRAMVRVLTRRALETATERARM